MDIKILKEDFENASREYSAFCDALFNKYKDAPLMCCILGHLNRLADDYYQSMIRIYRSGMTLDETLRLEKGV